MSEVLEPALRGYISKTSMNKYMKSTPVAVAILPQWLSTPTPKMGGWLHRSERHAAKVENIKRPSSERAQAAVSYDWHAKRHQIPSSLCRLMK